MSRFYDDNLVDVPINRLVFENYVYDGYKQYRRIFDCPRYFITDHGDVVSLVKEKPRILEPWENQHGHLYVHLTDWSGIRKKLLIHRLVAEAFIPNPHNYPIVRHLDDDPKNNYYRNLAWGTPKDNREDSIRNGNDYRVEVYCFETDEVYRSEAYVSRKFDIPKSQITRCCQGSVGHAHGYHFCYASEMEERKKDKSWLRNRSLKPVTAYGPNGEVLYFESRNDASIELRIPACGISSVINGRLKHTHGWRFKEGE